MTRRAVNSAILVCATILLGVATASVAHAQPAYPDLIRGWMTVKHADGSTDYYTCDAVAGPSSENCDFCGSCHQPRSVAKTKFDRAKHFSTFFQQSTVNVGATRLAWGRGTYLRSVRGTLVIEDASGKRLAELPSRARLLRNSRGQPALLVSPDPVVMARPR